MLLFSCWIRGIVEGNGWGLLNTIALPSPKALHSTDMSTLIQKGIVSS